MTEVISKDVDYFHGVNGYLACPSLKGNYPGIIMIHENRGLNETIKEYARTLARHEFNVLAVDLFKGETSPTVEGGMALTAKYEPQVGIDNMREAMRYLLKEGSSKIATMGFCFGGAQSLNFATMCNEKLDATVIFYGRLNVTKEELKKIRWPILGIFAEKDKHITPEVVNEFKKNLDDLVIGNEIYIYPGVDHAFANPINPQYAKEEAEDAWEKTIEFLNSNLKYNK